MAYPMFRQLNLVQSSETNYKLNFQIPDNCSYEITSFNGTFNIDVKLNAGHSTPSTNFIICKELASTNNQLLVVNVAQHERAGNIIKRPKVTVEL